MADTDTTIAGSMEDRHSRLAQSRRGRMLLVPLVAIMAAALTLPNLPGGPLRSDIEPLWRAPYELGLRQNWKVFSADPSSTSVQVAARIEYDDGTTVMWEVPEYDRIVGAYRQYRWQKWQERARLESYEDQWEPTAVWLAGQHERQGELPVRVTLIERTKEHHPLGSDGPLNGDWVENEYYTWEAAQ